MSQKIIKIGTSHGVTISSSLLEQIGLKLGDAVSLSYNSTNNTIEIKSQNMELRVEQLAEAKELIDEYSAQLTEIDYVE